MHQIGARQIKAARALLDWSQDDLAQQTGLAVTTIRNLEAGFAPRGTTAGMICQAIENAGLEFIDREGVRRRMDEVEIYQDADSSDSLFDDMLQTAKKQGGQILCAVQSQEMLMMSCGAHGNDRAARMQRLLTHADFMCLLPEGAKLAISTPQVQFRALAKPNIGPVSYFVYGGKHAIILAEGKDSFRFVVFKSPGLAHSYRAHFLMLWEKASPLKA